MFLISALPSQDGFHVITRSDFVHELFYLSLYKQFDNKNNVVNVYTGWPISNLAADEYVTGFTTVYTMIYDMINSKSNGQYVISVMHEMPFTVVTNANLKVSGSLYEVDRSLNKSNTGALVGSHTNRLGSTDTHAIYWFSRLIEYFDVKLCIGGHKHTYACTNPLREFYYYTENDTPKNSLEDGPMTMERTLQNDSAVWTATLYKNASNRYVTTEIEGAETITVNTTKFPLMKVSANQNGVEMDVDNFFPYYGVDSFYQNGDGVTYFMCQATGYKLKSNKELPSEYQQFSYVIPHTTVKDGSDKPDEAQLDPMFSDIILNGDSYEVYLRKIMNIFLISDNKHVLFSQLAYSTEPMEYRYLVHEQNGEQSIIFGKWVSDKRPLLTLV